MANRYLHLIIIICAAMMLAACASKPKKLVIGVSQCSQDTWREKLNNELKTGEYFNDSIMVRLASANDDNELQKQQIGQLVNGGIDLLIVSPNQMDDLSSAIDRVYDQGIPVILFDRKTLTGKYTAFIGGDNVVAGRVLAKYIAQRLGGQGRVVEITGTNGASATVERHQGFVEVMKDYPDIEIVATEEGDWKQESGRLAMRILTGQPFQRDNLLQTSLVTRDNVGLSITEAMDSERQRKNLDVLHAKVDSYIASYNSQKVVLWTMIICLAFVIIALVLAFRSYITEARFSEQLAKKNKELIRRASPRHSERGESAWLWCGVHGCDAPQAGRQCDRRGIIQACR